MIQFSGVYTTEPPKALPKGSFKFNGTKYWVVNDANGPNDHDKLMMHCDRMDLIAQREAQKQDSKGLLPVGIRNLFMYKQNVFTHFLAGLTLKAQPYPESLN